MTRPLRGDPLLFLPQRPMAEKNMTIKINPIGIIHSPYKSKESCPIQGAYFKESFGEIEIYTEYSDGLKDIETFSHIILLYHFDKAGEIKMVRPTFHDDTPPWNICNETSMSTKWHRYFYCSADNP